MTMKRALPLAGVLRRGNSTAAVQATDIWKSLSSVDKGGAPSPSPAVASSSRSSPDPPVARRTSASPRSTRAPSAVPSPSSTSASSLSSVLSTSCDAARTPSCPPSHSKNVDFFSLYLTSVSRPQAATRELSAEDVASTFEETLRRQLLAELLTYAVRGEWKKVQSELEKMKLWGQEPDYRFEACLGYSFLCGGAAKELRTWVKEVNTREKWTREERELLLFPRLSSLCRKGDMRAAEKLIRDLKAETEIGDGPREGVGRKFNKAESPCLSVFTYAELLKGFLSSGSTEQAEDTLSQLLSALSSSSGAINATNDQEKVAVTEAVGRFILHLVRTGDIEKGERLFAQLLQDYPHIAENRQHNLCKELIKAYGERKDSRGAKRVLALLAEPHWACYGALTLAYCKSGLPSMVEQTLDVMERLREKNSSSPSPPSVYFYGQVVHELCQRGHVYEALRVTKRFSSLGGRVNDVMLRMLVDGTIQKEDPELLQRTLRLGIETLHILSPDIIETVIRRYVQRGDLQEAGKYVELLLFVPWAQLDGRAACTLAQFYCKTGQLTWAKDLLDRFVRRLATRREKRGSRTTQSNDEEEERRERDEDEEKESALHQLMLFNIVLDGYAEAGKVEQMEELYEQMQSIGSRGALDTLSTLVKGYSRSKQMDKAEEIFSELINRISSLPSNPSLFSSSSAFIRASNALLIGYCQVNRKEKIASVLQRMDQHGLEPNSFTFHILMTFAMRGTMMEKGAEIFNLMLEIQKDETKKGEEKRDPLASHPATLGLLVDSSAYHGRLEVIDRLVEAHPMKDSQLACRIIRAYGRNLLAWRATHVVEKLKKSGVPLTSDVYEALVEAYGRAGNAEELMNLLKWIEEEGVRLTPSLRSALITAMALHGQFSSALALYRAMSPDAEERGRLLGSILEGLFKHKGWAEARRFAELEIPQLSPPSAEFYSAFIRCMAKARKLAGAEEALEEMQKKGLTPSSSALTHLAQAYRDRREVEKVLNLLSFASSHGVSLGKSGYKAILQCAMRSPHKGVLKMALERLKDAGLCEEEIYTHLFYAFSQEDRLEEAEEALRLRINATQTSNEALFAQLHGKSEGEGEVVPEVKESWLSSVYEALWSAVSRVSYVKPVGVLEKALKTIYKRHGVEPPLRDSSSES